MSATTTAKQVAATGDITTANAYLRNVIVSAGVDAASAVIRAGGAGGTVILTVKAGIGLTQPAGDLGRLFCGGGIHVTASGTAPAITVVYE